MARQADWFAAYRSDLSRCAKILFPAAVGNIASGRPCASLGRSLTRSRTVARATANPAAAPSAAGNRRADRRARRVGCRHGSMVRLAAAGDASARRCDRDAERSRRPSRHRSGSGVGAPGTDDRDLPWLALLGTRQRMRAEDTQRQGDLLRPEPGDDTWRGRVRRAPRSAVPLALSRPGSCGTARHRRETAARALFQREGICGQRSHDGARVVLRDCLQWGSTLKAVSLQRTC